jgi:hypothetical protein
LASCPNLRTLDMNGCNLTSLDGCAARRPSCACSSCTHPTFFSFPSLAALRKLHLSDNRIPGGLEALAAGAPNVTLLDLSNSKVSSAEALAPLAQLTQLSALDLVGCPIAANGDEDAYRAAVFAALPRLQWLDKKNRAGEEGEDGSEDDDDEEDDEEGSDEGEEDEEEDDEEAGLGTAFLLHGNADEADAGDGEFEGGDEEEEDDDIDEEDEEEEEAPDAAGAAKRQRTDAA